MKMIRLLLPVCLLSCLAACSASGDDTSGVDSAPMKYGSGDPASWPPELDAVAAAPGNHKVLLENDKVRVLEVYVAPGEVEPLHSHRWNSVLYIQETGDFLDRDADGNVIMDTREMDGPLPIPLAIWKDPEAPHSVENLSQTVPIRLIRVELK